MFGIGAKLREVLAGPCSKDLGMTLVEKVKLLFNMHYWYGTLYGKSGNKLEKRQCQEKYLLFYTNNGRFLGVIVNAKQYCVKIKTY